MDRRVLILMSTYNGGNKIKRQIKSILLQKKVDVYISIRDDGSDEDTKKILKDIQDEFPNRVTCIFENNIGWKESFMKLLYNASPGFEYYGFSDQDDIWMEDKVITCIKLMESDGLDGVKLAHCQSLSVDSNLQKRVEQEKRIAYPPSHFSAIATEYFQGCGMLWNYSAMKLIHRYKPLNKDLSHDYWVGLICYLFGKIYFCEESKFYHIRYKNNASEDGSVKKGRFKRIIKILNGEKGYMNPAQDLLNGYRNRLSGEDRIFLNQIANYQRDINCKINIIKNKEFRRPTLASTLLLKFMILLNNY